jgi:O-antigen biosynthesis protein
LLVSDHLPTGRIQATDLDAMLRSCLLIEGACYGKRVIVLGDETALVSRQISGFASDVVSYQWTWANARNNAAMFPAANLHFTALERGQAPSPDHDLIIVIDVGLSASMWDALTPALNQRPFIVMRRDSKLATSEHNDAHVLRERLSVLTPHFASYYSLYHADISAFRSEDTQGFNGFQKLTAGAPLPDFSQADRRWSVFAGGPFEPTGQVHASPGQSPLSLTGTNPVALVNERRALLEALWERDNEIRRLSSGPSVDVAAIYASTSWRITAPLRALARFARGEPPPPAREEKAGAPKPAKQKRNSVATRPEFAEPIVQSADTLLAPSVLIVADLTLQQCAKYRVWQKQQMLKSLGVACQVLEWTDTRAVRNALQLCSQVIFYRVPGFDDALDLIAEAHRLKVDARWESDDLIFDEQSLLQNKNLETLDAPLKQGILFGIPYYLKALRACGKAIASTKVLADRIRAHGVEDVLIIENALDEETLAEAENIARNPPRRDKAITIFYGSGSLAHDRDFETASIGIARVLEQRQNVRLVIAGHLTLPLRLEKFIRRIDRLPFGSFSHYLRALSAADICLAPLEATVFNDAKSNIKLLEGAICGVPCIASPCDTFAQAVENGVNGFLAETADDWERHLLSLVDDKSLRLSIGERAKSTALSAYAPEVIAKTQVANLLATAAERTKLRVLAVNVYFRPQSFGGATIVAEELASAMIAAGKAEMFVFTTTADPNLNPYDVVRYETDGVAVVAVKVPPLRERAREYENPDVAEVFAEVLGAVRPDVVHFHSVQTLGVLMMDVCADAAIPYVVTLHDAWWICERQFMVRDGGVYCNQTNIDLATCASCVPDIDWTAHRSRVIRQRLDGAAILLAPSKFHQNLHVENGLPLERIRLNQNGVRKPSAGFARIPSARLRFGFVGGIGPMKGSDLIMAAFAGLARDDYELILVDNMLNLGRGSINPAAWKLAGKVTIVPAYTRDTMDLFFSGIDVLLFPSQCKESFGLTVREALARDIWVIATDAGGAVEDIEPGVNGTVIEMAPDVAALRGALEHTLNDAHRMRTHINPLKDRVIGFDEQAAHLVDLLQLAVGQNRALSRLEGARN